MASKRNSKKTKPTLKFEIHPDYVDPEVGRPVVSHPDRELKIPNSIARASYYVENIPQERLIKAALKELQVGEGPLEVVLGFGDVTRLYGFSDGGKNKLNLLKAADSLAKSIPTVKVEYESFVDYIPWFDKVRIAKDGSYVRVFFNKELRPLLVELQKKKNFMLMSLKKAGKLNSFYAMRLYELLLSRRGHSGRDGNPEGCWFWQTNIEELRSIFNIGDKYEQTGPFLLYCVTKPIEEINKAEIGITVEVKKTIKGKTLEAIRFNVTEQKESNSEERILLARESQKAATDKASDDLVEKYEKEYKVLIDKYDPPIKGELFANTWGNIAGNIAALSSRAQAIEALKENHAAEFRQLIERYEKEELGGKV